MFDITVKFHESKKAPTVKFVAQNLNAVCFFLGSLGFKNHEYQSLLAVSEVVILETRLDDVVTVSKVVSQ